MSEVKRYRFKGAAGEYVYAGDFDNAAQCFLTAAEGCVAAERRETAAQKELGRYKEAYRGAVKGRSAFRDSVRRLRAERDALQLRLNAADQRIDELTAQHHSEDSLDMVAPSHEIPGTSGMRLNMLANQGE